MSLVTDPEEWEGGRASEVLRNKAEMLLVTDPEEWERLGGCGGPVRSKNASKQGRNLIGD